MMTLKNTFTTSRSSTEWGRNRLKHVWYGIVSLAVLGTIFFYLTHNSILLSPRERITIGVYGNYPYVLSYDRKDRVATVVYFDADKEVNIPGKYGWYKISSVNYLGAIDHKQEQLVRAMFQELVGVPVDLVLYPRKGILIQKSTDEFYTYFMANRIKHAATLGNVVLSTANMLDRILAFELITTRNDRLLLVDGSKNQFNTYPNARYDAERLDTLLQGYFYQSPFVRSSAKVIIHGTAKQYKAAVRLGRLFEGIGLKVHSVEVEDKPDGPCHLNYHDKLMPIVERLTLYLPKTCRQKKISTDTVLIDLFLDDSFIELYT